MKKFPNKLRLCGSNFDIKKEKLIAKDYYGIIQGIKKDETGVLLGYADAFNNKIRIHKELNDESSKQSLMHEITHCICYLIEQGLAYDEDYVQKVSTVLFSLIRDNKNLIKFIMEEDE